jgi:hypothetical protein
MTASTKNPKKAEILTPEVHIPGRVVLSPEELFALSAQLARRMARRISNDPEALKALAEAFAHTYREPPRPARSKLRRAASVPRAVEGDVSK